MSDVWFLGWFLTELIITAKQTIKITRFYPVLTTLPNWPTTWWQWQDTTQKSTLPLSQVKHFGVKIQWRLMTFSSNPLLSPCDSIITQTDGQRVLTGAPCHWNRQFEQRQRLIKGEEMDISAVWKIMSDLRWNISFNFYLSVDLQSIWQHYFYWNLF